MKATLLLTASINPGVSDTPMTAIKKPSIRLEQYRQTLIQMIQSACFDRIVLCENTNYEEEFAKAKELSITNGIQFEHLKFKGDYEKVHSLGKGFGEGEIIAYALENSKLLAESEHFYKLTGRIQISNIQELISDSFGKQVFIRNKMNEDSVDTRFFNCSKAFFKQHLFNVYQEVNDFSGNYLEKVYFKALKPLDSQIDTYKSYPKFIGFAGSTGQSYTMSFLKYRWYQLQLKAGKLSI